MGDKIKVVIHHGAGWYRFLIWETMEVVVKNSRYYVIATLNDNCQKYIEMNHAWEYHSWRNSLKEITNFEALK